MTRSRLPLLTAAVLTCVLALTGCAPETTEYSFATTRLATSSPESGSVPGFLPADATDVGLMVAAEGYGSQLRWRSPGGLTASYCTPGTLQGSTGHDATWWPSTTPGSGWRCGQWNVFTQGATYFAWDTRVDAN